LNAVTVRWPLTVWAPTLALQVLAALRSSIENEIWNRRLTSRSGMFDRAQIV